MKLNLTERKKRARLGLKALAKAYPDARCELAYADPFQLLVATILSAQCTDKAVNQATPGLFKKYPNAKSLAKAKPLDLEKLIRSIGLYRTKAKNLVSCAKTLLEKYAGQVPREREALIELAGVGRKTANVVLFNAFGLPGLAVDTHVLRLSQRLGWVDSHEPPAVEKELCELLPSAQWGFCSHYLIWHGRRICAARKPLCGACVLGPICPSFKLG